MKKIDKLILKAYLGPFLATLGILQFIFVLQHLWKYLDDIVGKGIEFWVILKMLYYTFFVSVPLALPLTVILASIMSIGNISEHNELTALKSSGVSFLRVLKPLWITSMVMMLVTFVFSNNVLPWALLKQKTIMRDIRKKKFALYIQEGVFYTDIKNHSIRIGKKHKNEKDIEDIIIYKRSLNGSTNVTRAKTGTLSFTDNGQFLIIDLFDGNNYDEQFKHRQSKDYHKLPHLKTHFKQQKVRFDLNPFKMGNTREELYKGKAEMMSISQLTELKSTIEDYKKDHHEKLLINSHNQMKYFRNLKDSLPQKTSFVSVDKDLENDIRKWIKTDKRGLILDNIGGEIRATYNRLSNFHASNDFEDIKMRKTQLQMHKKFTLALSCIILFMVGAPIGAVIKKGGIGLPVVFAVLFFLLYYMTSRFGETAGEDANLSLWLGAWLSNLLFLPFGILFMFQSAQDSPLFDRNFYKKNIRKLFTKK
ncbi:MAG: LptF/LptG family permease [Flavobacteriales bacterium]|nr:LptF/LptG family permease [Flavobacteriales bacterium]